MTREDERKVLLRAILEDPDNDDLRRMYAQFLRTHADELPAAACALDRARLIEVYYDNPGDEQWRKRLTDEYQMTHQNQEHWAYYYPGTSLWRGSIRGGFLNSLVLALPTHLDLPEQPLGWPWMWADNQSGSLNLHRPNPSWDWVRKLFQENPITRVWMCANQPHDSADGVSGYQSAMRVPDENPDGYLPSLIRHRMADWVSIKHYRYNSSYAAWEDLALTLANMLREELNLPPIPVPQNILDSLVRSPLSDHPGGAIIHDTYS